MHKPVSGSAADLISGCHEQGVLRVFLTCLSCACFHCCLRACRYERSGTMHGLFRVRGFTQDDAHIFCLPTQVGTCRLTQLV
jgi:hypothetical protein